MTERDKTRLKIKLCIAAVAGILIAQLGSSVHMYQSFTWANESWISYGLALVTVMMTAVLLVLAIISPPGAARNAVIWATGLLLMAEAAGNVSAGALIAMKAEDLYLVADFFGMSIEFARHAATMLFAGVIPAITFISILAVSKTAESILGDSTRSSRSEEMLRSILLEQEMSTEEMQGQD